MDKSNFEKPSDFKKPIIGITIGDAAGIGPEVVLKALADKSFVENFRPVLIGNKRLVIFKTADDLNLDFKATVVGHNDNLSRNVEQTRRSTI